MSKTISPDKAANYSQFYYTHAKANHRMASQLLDFRNTNLDLIVMAQEKLACNSYFFDRTRRSDQKSVRILMQEVECQVEVFGALKVRERTIDDVARLHYEQNVGAYQEAAAMMAQQAGIELDFITESLEAAL